MDERKMAMNVGAKISWSHVTRASRVRLAWWGYFLGMETRVDRMRNQVAAEGPKITDIGEGKLRL